MRVFVTPVLIIQIGQELTGKIEKKQFIELVSKIKNDNNWDCVIPISGGKDSTYQALTARRYGLNPLLVNSRTCDLSTIGRKKY